MDSIRVSPFEREKLCACSLPKQSCELVSVDVCGAQDTCERSSLEPPVAVNGHGDRVGDVWVPEDVMAAADPLDIPALLFRGRR